MSSEWERLYAEALQELDAERVPELCDRARRALNNRLVERAGDKTADPAEREQLFEALRNLLLYEYERRPPR